MSEIKDPLNLICKCCGISAVDYFENVLKEKVPESLTNETIWYCTMNCFYGRTAHD